MLKDRLSPAEEALRDKKMQEALAACPRILDLVARGPLADPNADAVIYLRAPLDPNPVVVSNDHLMGCVKAAENYFRARGIGKDDAVAMVKKATAFIKEQGPDKAYPEISNKAGKFIDRDLYVVVYQLDGKVLAHGSNEKFVGKDMIDAQDVDGKLYVKERVELAGKQPSFWQDYKFVNPVSKKVEPKQMYCEKLDNTAVCAGIYKL